MSDLQRQEHNQAEILDYFSRKASAYDDVEHQVYWRLSDALLWEQFSSVVCEKLSTGGRFLDAGGGTGRWTAKVLQEWPQTSGVIFDLSSEMTAQAAAKAEAAGWGDRFAIKVGALENVSEALAGETFDVIFNFHNVLGFVEYPEAVVGQLASLLSPGGLLISFLPNKFHAAFFNLTLGRIAEASSALRGFGRFTTDMPYMNMFCPASMAAMYSAADLSVTGLTGFPCLVYPGHQETQLHGSTKGLSELLTERKAFTEILEMERQALREPAIATRGNNLFIVGKKGE
jgi:SAM-dependent methyltransferase